MLPIAGSYTNAARKDAYLKAVEKFRLPFWDYHRPRDYDAVFPGVTQEDDTTKFPYDFSVPQILTLEEINVPLPPEDTSTPIKNPLYSGHRLGC